MLDKLLGVLHTRLAHFVKVEMVEALCDVGLYDDKSSSRSVCVGFRKQLTLLYAWIKNYFIDRKQPITTHYLCLTSNYITS